MTDLDRLAEALGVDTALLLAIASGTVKPEGITIRHPGGGHIILGTLDAWLAVVADVEDAGGPLAWDLREYPPKPPGPKPPRRRHDGPYFVYRLYDADDRLLYIGSTRNLDGRIRAHRRRWPDLIADFDFDEHPSAEAMLAAEAAAIRAICPPLNHAEVDA